MTKVITFNSKKGGVAKTGSATNIATALALKGFQTLLVDIDPQANATGYVGAKMPGMVTICDVIANGVDPKKAVKKTSIDNLYILPSSTELELIEFNNCAKLEHLRLKPLLTMGFDYIIFDCPTELKNFTPYALAIADYVMVPILVDQFGLDGFNQIIRAIKDMNKKLNPKLSLLGSFITMYRNTNTNKEIKEALKAQLADMFFDTTIRKSESFVKSTFNNLPVIINYPKSTVALDYMQLADEIINKLN